MIAWLLCRLGFHDWKHFEPIFGLEVGETCERLGCFAFRVRPVTPWDLE